MKKIIMTSVLALFVAGGAHATEWFVGGSVGFGYEKDNFSTFNIAPELGYNLTDQWDIGLMLRFNQYNDDAPGADYSEHSFGGGVFARYNVVSFGKLNVLFKGTLYVDYDEIKAFGGKASGTTFGANVIPMVTYQLSESFSLFAELNFLGVGIEKSTGDFSEYTRAGLFVDTNDVKKAGDIQIGFNYHF